MSFSLLVMLGIGGGGYIAVPVGSLDPFSQELAEVRKHSGHRCIILDLNILLFFSLALTVMYGAKVSSI